MGGWGGGGEGCRLDLGEGSAIVVVTAFVGNIPFHKGNE